MDTFNAAECHGFVNLLWDNTTQCNLARSLFFITQNSPGTVTARRSLLGSPAPSPSRSTVVKTFPLSGPQSTSGYPRDVTCPATPLCVQPYVSHVSTATCSVTSPFRLSTKSSDQSATACFPVLAPCVLAVLFGASAQSDNNKQTET